MQQLNFKGYSSTEWKNVQHFYHNMFWDEIHSKVSTDIKKMLQDQIYEEFDIQIGAKRYERTNARLDKRVGYRPRTYEVLGHHITGLKIPRARKLDIRFTVFDMWERVQSKVLNAMVTAYLLGKSSTAAQDIIESFGQSRFSRSYLQRLVKNFELSLKRYRQRKIIKHYPYIFVDGMAVKVYDTYLKEKTAIFALGMDKKHKIELLGWVVSDSEDEASVRSLLIDLKNRGLEMPEMFTSDDSGGIRAALRLEYPHTPWQLCAFHKIKNINDHLADMNNRKHILRAAGDIYQLSETKTDAVKRFKTFKKTWYDKEPEAVRLFSRGFEHTLRYFDQPKDMWVSIRTNNIAEQFIGKLRSWLSKFNYFQGTTNLELTIYTYLCYKNRGLVPEFKNDINLQKNTLLVA
jgi:putative transposase